MFIYTGLLFIQLVILFQPLNIFIQGRECTLTLKGTTKDTAIMFQGRVSKKKRNNLIYLLGKGFPPTCLKDPPFSRTHLWLSKCGAAAAMGWWTYRNSSVSFVEDFGTSHTHGSKQKEIMQLDFILTMGFVVHNGNHARFFLYWEITNKSQKKEMAVVNSSYVSAYGSIECWLSISYC